MPRFTKGFQLPHGYSRPKSSSVLYRHLHLNFGPPWMMTNKSSSMSGYPLWMWQLPALFPSSQGLAGLGMQAVVSAGIWGWCSGWEVTVIQELQRENCVEAVVQRSAWHFRWFPFCFPGLTLFQGYSTKIDGLSISKEILLLIVSSFCLLSPWRGGRKEAKRNICKTLCSCCNRWHTPFDWRRSEMTLTLRKLRWCAIRKERQVKIPQTHMRARAFSLASLFY